MNTSTDNQKLLDAIDVSIFPDFEKDITAMLKELREVYDNEPADVQAKRFADILTAYECVPDTLH